MATKVIQSLIDDIDGSPAEVTLRFSIEGVEYEIDLSKANETVFYSVMRPYYDHARRTNKPKRSSRRATNGYDPAKVREWAKGQGIELGERGRIPASVIQSYKVGHAN